MTDGGKRRRVAGPGRPGRRADCSRLPVLRLGLSYLSGLPGAHSRDRAARPQSLDRVQRPDLAGPRRFFCHRRLWRGDSDHEVRPAVLGCYPARERGVFRRRLPVRFSRAQVRRPLSRARHLRACGRHAPDPELHRLRRLHRRLAGTFAPQAARAAGAQAQPRPMALPGLPRLRRGALLGGAEPGARADRTGADRHPRPADRRRDDGRQCGALQDDVLWRQRALCRRGGGIERDRRRIRFARELRAAALARFSGRDRGRRPRLAQAACCSAPCSSNSCPTSPTSSRSISARAPRPCRGRFTARC